MKRCPKCKVLSASLVECDNCGVQFKDLGREQQQQIIETKNHQKPADGRCAYNNHGVTCDRPGVLSGSTTGSGPWYCREHGYLLFLGNNDGVSGNSLPEETQSVGTLEWHRKQLEHRKERGLDPQPMPDWVARRIAERSREPGSDDE